MNSPYYSNFSNISSNLFLLVYINFTNVLPECCHSVLQHHHDLLITSNNLEQLINFIKILKSSTSFLIRDKSFFLCQSPRFAASWKPPYFSLWVPVSFVSSVLYLPLWYSPWKNLQKYLKWSFIFRNWIFMAAEKNLLNNEDLVHFFVGCGTFMKLSSFCCIKSVLWNRVSQFSEDNYCFLTTTCLYELLVLLLQLDSVKCHMNKVYTVMFRISLYFLDCAISIKIILT